MALVSRTWRHAFRGTTEHARGSSPSALRATVPCAVGRQASRPPTPVLMGPQWLSSSCLQRGLTRARSQVRVTLAHEPYIRHHKSQQVTGASPDRYVWPAPRISSPALPCDGRPWEKAGRALEEGGKEGKERGRERSGNPDGAPAAWSQAKSLLAPPGFHSSHPSRDSRSRLRLGVTAPSLTAFSLPSSDGEEVVRAALQVEGSWREKRTVRRGRAAQTLEPHSQGHQEQGSALHLPERPAAVLLNCAARVRAAKGRAGGAGGLQPGRAPPGKPTFKGEGRTARRGRIPRRRRRNRV